MSEPTGPAPAPVEPAPAWTARAMLPAHPEAPVAARRLVSTLFLAWGLAEQVEVAELVVSELVSNSVRHAGDAGDLELEVIAEDDLVRLSVADGSPVHPVLRTETEQRQATDRHGGLGLHLVDRVSVRWGVEDYLFGKRVWVELSARAADGSQADPAER